MALRDFDLPPLRRGVPFSTKAALDSSIVPAISPAAAASMSRALRDQIRNFQSNPLNPQQPPPTPQPNVPPQIVMQPIPQTSVPAPNPNFPDLPAPDLSGGVVYPGGNPFGQPAPVFQGLPGLPDAPLIPPTPQYEPGSYLPSDASIFNLEDQQQYLDAAADTLETSLAEMLAQRERQIAQADYAANAELEARIKHATRELTKIEFQRGLMQRGYDVYINGGVAEYRRYEKEAREKYAAYAAAIDAGYDEFQAEALSRHEDYVSEVNEDALSYIDRVNEHQAAIRERLDPLFDRAQTEANEMAATSRAAQEEIRDTVAGALGDHYSDLRSRLLAFADKIGASSPASRAAVLSDIDQIQDLIVSNVFSSSERQVDIAEATSLMAQRAAALDMWTNLKALEQAKLTFTGQASRQHDQIVATAEAQTQALLDTAETNRQQALLDSEAALEALLQDVDHNQRDFIQRARRAQAELDLSVRDSIQALLDDLEIMGIRIDINKDELYRHYLEQGGLNISVEDYVRGELAATLEGYVRDGLLPSESHAAGIYQEIEDAIFSGDFRDQFGPVSHQGVREWIVQTAIAKGIIGPDGVNITRTQALLVMNGASWVGDQDELEEILKSEGVDFITASRMAEGAFPDGNEADRRFLIEFLSRVSPELRNAGFPSVVEEKVIQDLFPLIEAMGHRYNTHFKPNVIDPFNEVLADQTGLMAQDILGPTTFHPGFEPQHITPLDGIYVSPVTGWDAGRIARLNNSDSDFGAPRSHGPHQGMDLRGNEGDPVRAVAAGTVKDVYYSTRGGGWIIEVDHGAGHVSRYMHNGSHGVHDIRQGGTWVEGRNPSLVSIGDVVYPGQPLAPMGDTGNPAVGAFHVHFEYHVNGKAVNPVDLFGGGVSLGTSTSKPPDYFSPEATKPASTVSTVIDSAKQTIDSVVGGGSIRPI